MGAEMRPAGAATPTGAESKGKNYAADSDTDFPTKQPLDTIPTHPPAGTPLTPERARELTDAIRRDMAGVWMQLLRAYEGNAHAALGYTSWGDYCSTEFGIERSRSYRMLNAARVVEVIAQETQSPMGDSTAIPERVARELTPLLDEPETLVATFEEAKADAPKAADGTSKVTAKGVRDRVQAKINSRPAAAETPRGAHLADRPVESGTRIAPVAPVTTIAQTSSEPQTLAEAVRRVAAHVRNAVPGADVISAAEAALKVHSARNSLPGSAVLAELVGELLDAVRVLAKEVA
ncbi:MAG TPA: hypothetical protein PJ986_04175 [Gammaproteobacteria bacterium]|nr:hypothetical protein [Gammaproteobacteria bacterium]